MAKERESNIKDARPKQGLETKSIQGAKGGVGARNAASAKDRVAESYEADLSGSNGPRARFEAIDEMIGNRISEFSGGMMFSSSGGVAISGFGGMFTVHSERYLGRSYPAETVAYTRPDAWSLLPGGGDDKYTVQPGKIYYDYGDWTKPAEIKNFDKEWPVSGEGWIWIELDITDPAKPKMEMKAGKAWGWHPKVLEEQSSGGQSVRKAAFPVWQFRKGTEARFPSETMISEKLVGERFLSANHSVVVWGTSRNITKDGRNDQTFAPVLMPLS